MWRQCEDSRRSMMRSTSLIKALHSPSSSMQAMEARFILYLDGLSRKMGCQMCPAYIAGLIGAGDHKSIQPMAVQ